MPLHDMHTNVLCSMLICPGNCVDAQRQLGRAPTDPVQARHDVVCAQICGWADLLSAVRTSFAIELGTYCKIIAIQYDAAPPR
jgi:hypothetical protein